MPKKVESNELAISRNELRHEFDFLNVVSIHKYICDSFYSYGCDQVHLVIPKVIFDNKSAICQDQIELWLSFCGKWINIHRNRKLILIANSLTVWLLNFGAEIFSANQIVWLFYITNLLNGLIFLLHFERQYSIMIETNWINFSHWWILGYFAGVPWNQACFFF